MFDTCFTMLCFLLVAGNVCCENITEDYQIYDDELKHYAFDNNDTIALASNDCDGKHHTEEIMTAMMVKYTLLAVLIAPVLLLPLTFLYFRISVKPKSIPLSTGKILAPNNESVPVKKLPEPIDETPKIQKNIEEQITIDKQENPLSSIYFSTLAQKSKPNDEQTVYFDAKSKALYTRSCPI